MTRATLRAGTKAVGQAVQRAAKQAATKAVKQAVKQAVTTAVRQVVALQRPPAGPGDWVAGVALGPAGARRFQLFKPPGVRRGERRPLLVMLHGCAQDAFGFAHITRLHRLAARERCFVLWPEQERSAHPQGCWNWFGTRAGQAQAEAATLMAAIDQVARLYPVDQGRVAIAGFSAGASMAALLATRHPERFRAVVMHSGVPPGSAHSTATAIGAMHGRRAPVLPGPAEGAALTWPPLLVIQGAADAVVAPANGRAAAELWAAAAGARASAGRALQRGRRHAMTVTDFKQRGRAVATLCEVHGLGHAWSGGAARLPFSDSKGPDAARLLWAFVARQFRAADAAATKPTRNSTTKARGHNSAT